MFAHVIRSCIHEDVTNVGIRATRTVFRIAGHRSRRGFLCPAAEAGPLRDALVAELAAIIRAGRRGLRGGRLTSRKGDGVKA
jgi:hypothetical protein